MSSSAGRLYRILSFDRVVQMFEKEQLHLAHPSSWDVDLPLYLRTPVPASG